MKYILGLAIDFTLLAQRLSFVDNSAKQYRGNLTEYSLFSTYTLITERGSRQANTLTVRYGTAQEGIRRIEEKLIDLFHQLNRSSYPSAYVYTTGQWKKYQDLLVTCFKLSDSGRYILCQKLVNYGLKELSINKFFGRTNPRTNLFEEIILNYPRSASGENGGLVFQAIAYGFFSADRPHLDLIADKVRTGSARQRRFGDIDGYYGLDLELSVEVKDLDITSLNLDRQFGGFITHVSSYNLLGIAFAVSFDVETDETLRDSGILPLSQDLLLNIISTWDWHKQDRAVHGVLHYLSHIEQNPVAGERLLRFIEERDSNHASLEYLR